MERWLRAVGQALAALYLFIRIPVLGFSAILPLLGATSVSPRLAIGQTLGLLGVAIAFHNFGYVLNDVIDLPLDRTESLRSDFPLVRGAIGAPLALAFALAQIPLALALSAWLGASSLAYATLVVSFLLGTIYDLWGKRTRFPPLTDLIQGLAWSGMVLFGALVAGRPTPLTGMLVAFVIVFILMINGVHGAMRDLENDFRCGARTTAIMLGAHPRAAAAPAIPPALALYTLGLQLLLIALTLLPLARNWFGYEPAAWWATAGAMLGMGAISLALLVLSARLAGNRRDMIFAGTWHLVVVLSSLLVLFAAYLDRATLVALLAAYFLPLATSFWLYISLWEWKSRLAARKSR